MSDVVYKPVGSVKASNVTYSPKQDYFNYEQLFKEHGTFINLPAASESDSWTDLYFVPSGKTLFITDFQFTTYIHTSAGTTTGYALWLLYSRYDTDFLARHNQTGVVGNSINTTQNFINPIKVNSGSYVSVFNGYPTRCGYSAVVFGYLVDNEWANYKQQII